jgi:copper transport protein
VLRILLGVLFLAAAGAPLTVSAHANLVRSDPPAGAVLPKAPQVVVLEFSEDLDAHFSKVKLVDASSQVVVEGPGAVDPAAPRVLHLDLPPLQQGSYSAIWQARSAMDGHVTEGSVGFSVGAASPNVSLLPPPGTPLPAQAFPPAGDMLIHWAGYLVACLAAGSWFFGLFVWRPAFRGWDRPVQDQDVHVAGTLRRLSLLGVAAMALVTLAFIFYQVFQATTGEFRAPFWTSLWQLVSGPAGVIFLARLVLLVAMSWLIRRLPPVGGGSTRTWWVVIALGLAMLLTFSLQSHAVASGSALTVVADWLHMSAMGAWLGGLLPLFLVMNATTLPLDRLIPRFSRLALISVAVLAFTGFYGAYLHVGSLDALIQTAYGWTLAVKVAFFGLLMLLGAINLVLLSPRLAGTGTAAARGLRRTVPVEMALGVVVLLAAGVLASASPSQEALEAQRNLGFFATAKENDIELKLMVVPARAGENEFGVDLSGQLDGAQANPRVLLRLKMASQDSMGVTQVDTQPADGQQRYVARGSYLTMEGPWQVEVIFRRDRYNDIRHAFDLLVSANP